MCKHRSNHRKKHGKTMTQRRRAIKKLGHKLSFKQLTEDHINCSEGLLYKILEVTW